MNVFSIELMGPSHPPQMLGHTRGSEHDHSLLTHLLPHSDLCRTCTHQSCFVSHPSLGGRGRDPSGRLILNCFHSLGWHPVSEVIYTVAWWKLVYNATWSKMILLASWSEHPSINALRATLLATKRVPGRCLCCEASPSRSHIFFKIIELELVRMPSFQLKKLITKELGLWILLELHIICWGNHWNDIFWRVLGYQGSSSLY